MIKVEELLLPLFFFQLLLGKVPLLIDGDGPGVCPRFIFKEITHTCLSLYLDGHSGRDNLKFFAKDTVAFGFP